MGKLIAMVLVTIISVCGYFLLKDEELAIISPLPKVFGSSDKTDKAVNNWFPEEISNKNGKELTLNARSAFLVDYGTGEVIFAKDADTRLPVASTVKIMTALVALENAKLSDTFTVSKKASEVGENSMGLIEGERLTLEELLHGAMMVSGNDAAVVIAEGVSTREEEFVMLMNKMAKSLGLHDSEFANASGLDKDGKLQYSTAYDLSVIARYTWENFADFRKIVSSYHKVIEANSNHQAFDLYNDTNLLTTYPGVKGIKPGFTWDAGWCLVTYAENEGKRLIGVILGSDDRRGEMKELLDFGFANFGISVDHPVLDL